MLRQKAVLTQKELAQRSGISENTINLLESGRRPPRPKTTRALAQALGVRPTELVA
jgi:transcriptional regulator with XRE-family HTH domain